jgi:O-antigen/teichoic acid export membrane protein
LTDREPKDPRFIGSVAILFGGEGLAQAARLLLTPVVARLFLPEHFGVAALFFSVAVIISSFACLKYDQAIILPEDDSKALRIGLLGVIILLPICFLVLGLAMILLHCTDLSWAANAETWFYALPLAILMLGAGSLLSGWNLRKKRFQGIAQSKIANSLGTSGSRIGFGILFGSSVGGLIAGIFCGLICRIGILFVHFRKSRLKAFPRTTWIKLVELAKEYKDFPLYSAPGDLIRNFSLYLPVIMLALLYSNSVVGFYALSNRLVRMPLDLITHSVRNAYLQKSSELRNRGAILRTSLTKLTISMAGLGSLPFLAVLLFGKTIVVLVLGAEWSTTGKYLQILAPAYYVTFVVAPSSALFVVFRRQGLWFRIQVGLTICTLSVFALSYLLSKSAAQTLILYSLVRTLFGLGTLFAAFVLSGQVDRELKGTFAGSAGK